MWSGIEATHDTKFILQQVNTLYDTYVYILPIQRKSSKQHRADAIKVVRAHVARRYYLQPRIARTLYRFRAVQSKRN